MPLSSWFKQYGVYNSNMRISAKAVGTGAVLDAKRWTRLA